VDPVHTMPGGERFAAALSKVGLAVSVSSHASESAQGCAMVLPTHDTFEDWGDEEPWAGFRIVRQPATVPLGDTRSLGDLLLEISREADPAAAPAEASFREWLEGRYASTFLAQAPEAGATPPAVPLAKSDAFRRWWEQVLVRGVHEVRAPRAPLEVTGTIDFSGAFAPVGSGTYVLAAYPHNFKLDGRYANEPWANEVPDPLTGQAWDTWALVHADTAAKLGVVDNDLVTITTAAGAFQLGVEIHPLVRPDVIAVPMGGGFTAAKGRYAEGVGVNVAKLIPATRDPSGALVWQGTRCEVAAAGAAADLVSTFGNDTDEHRNFVAVVEADHWAKVGDAEAEHPGDLTGIHHLKMDRRLLAREATFKAENPKSEPERTEYVDFYPVPDHPTYRFAMTIDTNSCTGCGACVVACYAENNLPIVGKWKMKKARQMAWIRVDRFFSTHAEGGPSVHWVPLPCQHCGHAPCESVCPVLATYHTIDGLNAMIYNRCVGTRYCSNACPYSARRFNYHTYDWPEPFNLQLNPDVLTRSMGVMEKCTFCVQRIRRTKAAHREQGFTHTVPDEALHQLTACAEACPSQAIGFGNLLDPESVPAKTRKTGRNYLLLTELNTFPAINYLARASHHVHRAHPGGHEAGAEQGGHPTHQPPAGEPTHEG
jgi:Fe-S-cluster-containing dehydrogenase component